MGKTSFSLFLFLLCANAKIFASPFIFKNIQNDDKKADIDKKEKHINNQPFLIGGGHSVQESLDLLQKQEEMNTLYEEQKKTFEKNLAIIKDSSVSDREFIFYIKQRNLLIHNKTAIFATKGETKDEKNDMCYIIYGDNNYEFCPF